jgi:hypothetical protein
MCAGSGGAMLLGRDADVYFTGEMSHVRSRVNSNSSSLTDASLIAARSVGGSRSRQARCPLYAMVLLHNRRLCTDTPLDTRWSHEYRARISPCLGSQKLRAELQKFRNTDAFASLAATDQDIVRHLEVHVSVEDHHPLQFV